MGKSLRLENDTWIYPYFPIGYIYISAVEIDPATYFGGTWEQIQGKFLLACSSDYSSGSTGGEATHTHSNGTLMACFHPYNDYGNAVFRLIENENNRWSLTNYKTSPLSSLNDGGGSAIIGTDVVGSTGSSSNMPPYLAVYMYKKTAN